MKRIGGLVLVAACIGVLSSCVSLQGLSVRSHGDDTGGSHDFSDVRGGGGSVDSGVADATATGKSGVSPLENGVLPPLGSFDRSVPGFRVFDPCTEQMRTYVADMGLVATGEVKRESGFRSCRFVYESSETGIANVTFETRDFSMTEVKNAFPEGRPGAGRYQEIIYFVIDLLVEGATCTGFIETEGGTFSISWTELSAKGSNIDNCKNVERVVGSLL